MQEAELKLSKGDWVFHPRMPDWGYGQVLELLNDNKGRVFFLLAGEKKISWEHAGLSRVEGDKESQAALNDQITEFKVKLAKDIFSSEELGEAVTCTSCESSISNCELCKCIPENLRVYNLAGRGKMYICDECRDKIMLEVGNSAGTDQEDNMAKGSKKPVKRKLKTAKK